MFGLRQHIAVHLGLGWLFQYDFRAQTLHLLNGRVGGQRVLLRLADNGLVHYVAEQVGPTQDAAGGVDDFKIEDAVIIGRGGHEREYGNLPAIAGHHRAKCKIIGGVCGAVGAGDGQIAAEFRGEQVFHAAHEVCQPADIRLQVRIGVVDHGGVEADACDNQERMAVVVLGMIEQRESAHVHHARSVRCGHGQGRIDIVHRNAHIAGKEIAGANRHNAQCVAGAGYGARHRAYSAVASDRDHHVSAVFERLERTGTSVLVELGVVEAHPIQTLGFAELLNVEPACGGLWLGWVHHERILHLVIPAFLQCLGQFAATVRPQRDDDDGNTYRDDNDRGHNKKYSERRLGHDSYC